MIAGDQCGAQGIARKSSANPRSNGCHSRPRLKHSRAGYSGNPFGVRSLRRRLNLKAGFSAYTQWIPAFAGMTIGIHQPAPPTGMPVKAIFMRLPGHALPRRGGLGLGKRQAVPSNAEKCRVDQALRIHPTPCHPEQREGSALRNLARQY